jgi:hypothetical protein
MKDKGSDTALLTADVWVRTDDLSRHPESQIRAERDARLVAEYAEAMLEGAQFPPVVIFQDPDGWKYLADGHNRVDAAALAALKDPRRNAEVLADVKPGTFEDALRWAMRANRLHGKRMTDADHKRAIEMAIDHSYWCQSTRRMSCPRWSNWSGAACALRKSTRSAIARR